MPNKLFIPEENLNLACTPKTIQRDILTLKNNFGAPIAYDVGRNGYYLTRRNWNFSCPQIFDDSCMLSAVLAASMSTADSQLLSASSALTSDICKPLFGTERMTDKRIMWIGRIVVLLVAFAALALACIPGAGSIMSLVGNAWGVFGAAFGPAILLSLFWKRFNFAGAATGIIVGALADVAFLFAASTTGIYELFPGFIAGAAAAVIATICTAPPSKEETALFERAVAYRD